MERFDMGYLHIGNLYKNTTIMLFRECYALEKIHGTSAHIVWREGRIGFSSGGARQDSFEALFPLDMFQLFENLGHDTVRVYGEAYGGKIQKMSKTYGPLMRFVVFDVRIGDTWLDVPNAKDVAHKLGLEFVHYIRIPTDMESINTARDACSVQAFRNGLGDMTREGIVLRPLQEFTKTNGERVIAKYKRDEFKETSTPREVDPEKQQVLADADAVALEWVTDARLRHVLDRLPSGIGIRDMGTVLKAMVEDVVREAGDEIVNSKAARKAVAKRAAALFKIHLSAEFARKGDVI